MKISVVIPAYNECDSVGTTVTSIATTLEREAVDYEIIVVDDASSDGTSQAVEALGLDRVQCFRSHYPRGFGFAVRAGLDRFTGDAVAVMMADGSDDPEDLVRYAGLLESGYDCAFGSRFIRG